MSLLQWEKVAGECLTDEVFLDFYDSSSTATAVGMLSSQVQHFLEIKSKGERKSRHLRGRELIR